MLILSGEVHVSEQLLQQILGVLHKLMEHVFSILDVLVGPRDFLEVVHH